MFPFIEKAIDMMLHSQMAHRNAKRSRAEKSTTQTCVWSTATTVKQIKKKKKKG